MHTERIEVVLTLANQWILHHTLFSRLEQLYVSIGENFTWAWKGMHVENWCRPNNARPFSLQSRVRCESWPHLWCPRAKNEELELLPSSSMERCSRQVFNMMLDQIVQEIRFFFSWILVEWHTDRKQSYPRNYFSTTPTPFYIFYNTYTCTLYTIYTFNFFYAVYNIYCKSRNIGLREKLALGQN